MAKSLFSQNEVATSFSSKSAVASCGACGLRKTCKTPCMEPKGKGRKKILIVGEAPGQNEDDRGKPFVGKAGDELREFLDRVGIDMWGDCLITNAIRCRPPDNKTPTLAQIKACMPLLWKTIKEFNPHVIIPVGMSAVDGLTIGRTSQRREISRWRGWTIPDIERSGAWICPTFHPAFINRPTKYQEVAKVLFEQDLQRAYNCLSEKLPDPVDYESIVIDEQKALEEADKLLDALDKEPTLVAVDYETNMLKPYSSESKLFTAGFCWEYGSFAMKSAGKAAEKVRSIVVHKNFLGIAAKMSMERGWSLLHFGNSGNWVWDTVLAAHILDHRSGTANVKFQAFVRLGVPKYDAHIERYLRGEHGNQKNKIEKLNVQDVLKYNAIDALVEWYLAIIQMQELEFDSLGKIIDELT